MGLNLSITCNIPQFEDSIPFLPKQMLADVCLAGAYVQLFKTFGYSSAQFAILHKKSCIITDTKYGSECVLFEVSLISLGPRRFFNLFLVCHYLPQFVGEKGHIMKSLGISLKGSV